jgi:hypothetical protein
MDFNALSAPFPPERIEWRVGATKDDKSKGMALAYIDARDVMDRLDKVCGPANWQCRYSHAMQKTICDIGIRIDDEWVWKADGSGDSDTEAEKGAMSGAFKRAAVRWGIGRYLYDIKSPWVALKAVGNPNKPTYVFANDHDPAFRQALTTALGGPVGGGQASPQRTTSNAQSQEEPQSTGTGRRTPDEPRDMAKEAEHVQEHVALTKLVRGQNVKSDLDELLGTARFQSFKEAAPFLAGQLRGEIKAQYDAINAAGLVNA